MQTSSLLFLDLELHNGEVEKQRLQSCKKERRLVFAYQKDGWSACT